MGRSGEMTHLLEDGRDEGGLPYSLKHVDAITELVTAVQAARRR